MRNLFLIGYQHPLSHVFSFLISYQHPSSQVFSFLIGYQHPSSHVFSNENYQPHWNSTAYILKEKRYYKNKPVTLTNIIMLRYTNADLKIYQYLCLHMKLIWWRFHIKTFYFLRHAHVRYVTSRANITREFLELRMRNFQGIGFIWTQTYTEIFKSALVYL